MAPKEKQRRLSASSDTEITRLLASLIDFQDKSPNSELEDDKTIINLVDKLTDALSTTKVLFRACRVRFHTDNLCKDYPFTSATVETLEKAGIVRDVERSPLDSYGLDDPAKLAEHAARYRAMSKKEVFLTADNFDGLYNTIVRHTSTIVRRLLLL